MRIQDIKQQTVVLKLQAKSKEALFSMQDPTVSHLYGEPCHTSRLFLTQISAKQVTIKELDKFLHVS